MMAVSLKEGVEEHKNLVHYVAQRFKKRAVNLRVEYDEVVSEGMIGLIKALQKFDESYGVKFSTYAVPLIEGELRRFFRDLNLGPKFSRTAKELAAKLTGEETVKEITEKFQVPKWRAEEALASKTINITASIDMKLNDPNDKDLTLMDLIEYREDFSGAVVDDFLSTLTPKQKKVVLLAMKDHYQQEIADKVGCSQVQVSRILRKIGELYQKYLERGNEGMNQKHIGLRIIDLIDQHGDSFETCQGCDKCTEIKQLRKSFDQDPCLKYKHILDKGQDMTKSDIAFLLENGVQKKVIQKALKMHNNDFLDMMANLGFTKRRKPKEEIEMGKIKMSAEEYVDLRYKQKLSFVQIAKLKGVADPTIHYWKDRHADEIKKALKSLNLPVKEEKTPAETAKKAAAITIQKLKQPAPVKTEPKELEPKPIQKPTQPDTNAKKAPEPKPIGEAINEADNEVFAEKKAEYERLIAALRADLTEAHKQLDERDETIRNLKHLHDACEDCESEISSLQQEKEELERKFSLVQETAKQTNHNYLEMAKKLKPLEEENQAMRLLIKKWA